MASISDIESLVKTEINPALKVHNGFIIIHDYDESLGVLKIAMGGGCQGCAGSSETLKLMVEHAIRGKFPEVKEVIDITRHDLGQNPFYP